MNKDEYLHEAEKRVYNVPKNTKFLLKDLFTGIEWKAIPKHIRINVGGMFLEYAKRNKDVISVVEKTTSNQQQYIKL